jgi:hypothetical protein
MQELAMNLKITSRNPVSPPLCVSPDGVFLVCIFYFSAGYALSSPLLIHHK